MQLPDEFALLLGGRVGTHVGFLVEGQLAGDGPVLAGFKLPMMWKLGGVQVGAVPFTTDSLGASYGSELLSTGAVRNIRASADRSETSAQQYVFVQGTGPLSGDVSPEYPVLAGASAEYLTKQVSGFKAGARKNILMP